MIEKREKGQKDREKGEIMRGGEGSRGLSIKEVAAMGG